MKLILCGKNACHWDKRCQHQYRNNNGDNSFGNSFHFHIMYSPHNKVWGKSIYPLITFYYRHFALSPHFLYKNGWGKRLFDKKQAQIKTC